MAVDSGEIPKRVRPRGGIFVAKMGRGLIPRGRAGRLLHTVKGVGYVLKSERS